MSGLIPQAFIDEIINETDIVEFIETHVRLKKQGNSYVACCPFHHEKSPSFNVNAKKQFYHCFGCGASGNVIGFAINYLRLSFPDAIETLAGRLGKSVIHEQTTKKSNKSAPDLHQLLKRVADFYQHTLKTQGEAAQRYMESRGVDAAMIDRYALGYATPGWHGLETTFKPHIKALIQTGMLITKDNDGSTYDRYRDRLMFPIHNRHGHIIGFGGRVMQPDQKPKYLNSPETVLFQKGKELYGLYQIIQHNQQVPCIIIVEGYMDVIALAQHGINYAVATLGTATTSYHIQRLAKHTTQLIFCFDGDEAGKKAAWRALESTLPHLDGTLDARFVFLPETHDPDSLIRNEGKLPFLQRLATSTPIHQFFFERLQDTLDMRTLSGKSQLVTRAKPYLHVISNGPFKQLLLNELTRFTRIEYDRLQHILEDNEKETTFSNAPAPIKRTPTRVAIALLLQYPHLYHDSDIAALLKTVTHQPILCSLIEKIEQYPSLNTAALTELWRDTEAFEGLNQLAVWDHMVPETTIKKEFIDILLFLNKQNRDSIAQQLLDKARRQGLDDLERVHLQNLLKQRHKEG